MKKIKIISLLLAVVLFASGCSLFKGKNDIPMNESKPEEKAQTVEEVEKPSAWKIDEEISVEAAKMMAEAEGIPFTKEAMIENYQNSYDNKTKPQGVGDLQYNLNALENMIGVDNMLAKLAPQYVMTKMREKKEEEMNNISKEDLDSLLKEYKEFMDTMGIVESAREEYVKSMYLSSQVELDIDEVYQEYYSKAVLKVFSKYNPEYIKSLDLKQ